MTTSTIIANAACLGCGCACDDIEIAVESGRIVEARNACPLGHAWFGDGRVPARCTVGRSDTATNDAVTAAADLLVSARRALVYLAPGLSCESQRAGVAIADMLGAVLDTATTATALDSVLVAQERGMASATLGEVRNRADVVLFWAVDLATRYPRFWSRYAPEPSGAFVPDGRSSRRVIAVDVGQAVSSADADHRVAIDPSDEVATLTVLQALVSASAHDQSAPSANPGRAWTSAGSLAPLLLGGRYVAIVYDAEADQRAQRSPSRFDALTGLAQALNGPTRCAAVALRAGGNRSGADAMLTAQTGYPLAVDFARGYPRYRPHYASAVALLAGGGVDAALVLGDAALLPSELTHSLATVACVVIGPRATEAPLGAAIAIDAGVPGIHSPGTALRTDDVPLPLRPSLEGPPSVETLLSGLTQSLSTRSVA